MNGVIPEGMQRHRNAVKLIAVMKTALGVNTEGAQRIAQAKRWVVRIGGAK
jgi:hypothetical protein